MDQNWRESGLRQHTKNLGPPIISATVVASSFQHWT